MSVHNRPGGVSVPAYILMAVLALVGFALNDATGGRSWGVLALCGLLAVVDCAIYFRQPSVRAPKRGDEINRPLSAVAGMVAAGALIVVGVLAALGGITFE